MEDGVSTKVYGSCDPWSATQHVFMSGEFAEKLGRTYDDYVPLIYDALDSLLEDEIISIDIRPCNHPLFEAIGAGCDHDPMTLSLPTETPIKSNRQANIGYNGRFFIDEYWRDWNNLSKSSTVPKSFGTRLGSYMYRADALLKSKILKELIPMYESGTDIPPNGFIRMIFVPDPDFSKNGQKTAINEIQMVNIETAESNEIIKDFQRSVDALFATDDILVDLNAAFHATLWAYQIEKCKAEEDLPSIPERPFTPTPTSYALSVTARPYKDQLLVVEGGVMIHPSIFEDKNASLLSVEDEQLINEVVDLIPVSDEVWIVETDRGVYHGISF